MNGWKELRTIIFVVLIFFLFLSSLVLGYFEKNLPLILLSIALGTIICTWGYNYMFNRFG